MRRVLAIGFAVLLVALALVVRSRIDSGKAADEATANRPSGNLVCATELKAVCAQLAKDNPAVTVRVEEAGITYKVLTASGFDPTAAKIDAWLVPQPWPAMVEEARRAASEPAALGDPSAVLGRSPVVLVGWNDRLAALQKSCAGGTVDWKCIGAVAGKPWTDAGGQPTWGAVKPGFGPFDVNATGLFVFAQATGQFLGRPDYARNDLDDPAYAAWATQLVQAVPTFTPSAGTAVDQMLFSGPSSFDVAGSLEALAAAPVTTGRYKDQLTILYPATAASADVVLAPVRGSEPGGRVKQLLESNAGAQALAQSGWRVDGQPSGPGVRSDQPLPASGNGLPRAGVLEAVRETWSSVQ